MCQMKDTFIESGKVSLLHLDDICLLLLYYIYCQDIYTCFKQLINVLLVKQFCYRELSLLITHIIGMDHNGNGIAQAANIAGSLPCRCEDVSRKKVRNRVDTRSKATGIRSCSRGMNTPPSSLPSDRRMRVGVY